MARIVNRGGARGLRDVRHASHHMSSYAMRRDAQINAGCLDAGCVEVVSCARGVDLERGQMRDALWCGSNN